MKIKILSKVDTSGVDILGSLHFEMDTSLLRVGKGSPHFSYLD